MELEQANAIAALLVAELGQYCQKVVVAGSIRRQRPLVGDIDLVVIPANQGQLAVKLHELGLTGGNKILRAFYRGAPVDLYLATEETFPMLLLVRTGSAAHNKWLAGRAKSMGLHFAADGRGILKDGARVAWRSEEEILAALGLHTYIPPEQRERLS
mgnify:CR=1 FL=1